MISSWPLPRSFPRRSKALQESEVVPVVRAAKGWTLASTRSNRVDAASDAPPFPKPRHLAQAPTLHHELTMLPRSTLWPREAPLLPPPTVVMSRMENRGAPFCSPLQLRSFSLSVHTQYIYIHICIQTGCIGIHTKWREWLHPHAPVSVDDDESCAGTHTQLIA